MSFFASYSWQDEPELKGIPTLPMPDGSFRPAINLPPQQRVNGGVILDTGGFFVTGSVNHQDEAYWADVADPRNWGPTAAFTMYNASIGARLSGGRLVLSVRGQNITDARVQQHNWGDFIGRKITGQVEVRF